MTDMAFRPEQPILRPVPLHYAPLRTVNVTGPLPNFMQPIPRHLADYPSMMSVDEKSLLYFAAKDYYKGEGLIIDAGIFLGASTQCFAAGLNASSVLTAAASDLPERKIVSFELGVVNPGMPGFFQRNAVDIKERPGQSFEPYLREALKPVESLVDLRFGDILETMQNVTSPVEILFLDVLKLPHISEAVLTHFFPRLIPGRSIVIQQDYFNELLEYIKVHQELFGKFFEYLGEVQSSAVFLCKKRLTKNVVKSMIEDVAADEQERLASVAMQRSIDPIRRFLMAVSKARLICRLHGSKPALAYLEKIRDDYPEEVIGGAKFQRRLGGVIDTAVAQFSQAPAFRRPPKEKPSELRKEAG